MSESYASGIVPLPTDTLRVLEVKLLLALGAFSGGVTATTGQVLAYTAADPTTQGLTPTDINSPAIAYPKNGVGNTYGWDTTNHVWV